MPSRKRLVEPWLRCYAADGRFRRALEGLYQNRERILGEFARGGIVLGAIHLLDEPPIDSPRVRDAIEHIRAFAIRWRMIEEVWWVPPGAKRRRRSGYHAPVLEACDELCR